MKPKNPKHSESHSESEPGPEFMAQQLRKPAGDFAQIIGRKMNQVNKPLYDLTFDVMELEKNDRVLEIGFGTGKFLNQLFDQDNTIQVSGIDYSEDMVKSARDYNQENISKGNLTFKLGDSKSIPFPNQSFDKVFCNMVIYFWDEPEEHLKEIQRVLKPGGLFYTGIRTRKSMLVFPFVKYGFNLHSINEWKDVLDQNGFLVKETRKKFDPIIDLQEQDKKLRLESCCIVAEIKKNQFINQA